MDYRREQFEQYAAQMGKKDFELDEFGNYRNPFVQEPWNFWRASRDALAALPSDAAQAPLAWARPDVAERLSSPLAIGVMTELLKKQKDGYVPIYAAPVAPAAAAPSTFEEYRRGVMEAFHCANMINANRQGRTAEETCAYLVRSLSELAAPIHASDCAVHNEPAYPNGPCDCGAQPDERAAFEAQWNVFLASGEHESDAYLMGWKVWQAARATAPQAMLTDEHILNAFELSGVEFQEVYSTTLKKWLPLTKGTQNANRLISAVRALLDAKEPTPIYQIGAPGVAGHHVVWWDVPQEEYERQRKAGSMKTGIVYREES